MKLSGILIVQVLSVFSYLKYKIFLCSFNLKAISIFLLLIEDVG